MTQNQDAVGKKQTSTYTTASDNACVRHNDTTKRKTVVEEYASTCSASTTVQYSIVE